MGSNIDPASSKNGDQSTIMTISIRVDSDIFGVGEGRGDLFPFIDVSGHLYLTKASVLMPMCLCVSL